MSFSLTAVFTGNLRAWSQAQAKAVDYGAYLALKAAADVVSKSVTRKIAGAGFRSPGLSRAIKSKLYGTSIYREARIYSVARLGTKGGNRRANVDLVEVFAQGTTIRGQHGWLAIPTGYGPLKGGRGRQRFATLDELIAQRYRLAILPASHPGRKVALLTFPSGRKVITHVLVRNVTLRKRYDVSTEGPEAQSRLPRLLTVSINRQLDLVEGAGQ